MWVSNLQMHTEIHDSSINPNHSLMPFQEKHSGSPGTQERVNIHYNLIAGEPSILRSGHLPSVIEEYNETNIKAQGVCFTV